MDHNVELRGNSNVGLDENPIGLVVGPFRVQALAWVLLSNLKVEL